jgi:hypothetical protein
MALDTRKQPEEEAKIGRASAPNIQLRRRRPLKVMVVVEGAKSCAIGGIMMVLKKT